MYFITGSKIKDSYQFFASCQSILCKPRNIDELIRLSLVQSNCLPILLYAIPALILTGQQVNYINIAWNSIYRNIFGFYKWESVRELMAGLGNLNLKHLSLRVY